MLLYMLIAQLFCSLCVCVCVRCGSFDALKRGKLNLLVFAIAALCKKALRGTSHAFKCLPPLSFSTSSSSFPLFSFFYMFFVRAKISMDVHLNLTNLLLLFSF